MPEVLTAQKEVTTQARENLLPGIRNRAHSKTMQEVKQNAVLQQVNEAGLVLDTKVLVQDLETVTTENNYEP